MDETSNLVFSKDVASINCVDPSHEFCAMDTPYDVSAFCSIVMSQQEQLKQNIDQQSKLFLTSTLIL